MHANNEGIINRLKRAEGHLKSISLMIESGRECLEIAQQLQAVENAINKIKKILVYDHIDHCLEDAVNHHQQNPSQILEEFKAITKYL